MSSKKQLRRQRRQQEREKRPRSRLRPPVMFALFVAAVIAIGLIAYFLHDPNASAPGPPPNPGAVWSEEHGHWH